MSTTATSRASVFVALADESDDVLGIVRFVVPAWPA
jgi:hypothetical protein